MKARYILTKAIANASSHHTLVTDTLLPVAIDYYKSCGDTDRWLKSNLLHVAYLRSTGRTAQAAEILDSVLATIPPDSVDRQYQLRVMRMNMNAIAGEYADAIDEADWLIYHTRFKNTKLYNAQFKMALLFMSGQNDLALAWADSVLTSDYAPAPGEREWADFMGDYAEILDESGQSRQAVGIAEEILNRIPDLSADEKAGFIISLAKYHANTGNMAKAKEYLAAADSLDINPNNIDNDYDSYLTFLRSAIRFRETGHLSALVDKRMKSDLILERRMNSDAVAEMNSLSAREMQLTLDKQSLIIVLLSVCLVVTIALSLLFWLMRRHRKRRLQAEERAETLGEMLRQIDKSDHGQAQNDDKDLMLKRMVLRQMGILKTFASAPTAQNQEALRKISGAGPEADKSGRLVDWEHLYASVDELYDGFHARLLGTYPDTFSEKEIQIICLLRADFSTKEIGVLTEQSSATIYVRKSAIRKKLHTPESGDFIAQLEARFKEGQNI